MYEFFEWFYTLKPVPPMTWISYLIIAGVFLVVWIAAVIRARKDERGWFKAGSMEFAKVLWQAVVLDRTSLKLVDLYFSCVILIIITRTAILVEYLPTLASVLMLIYVWAMWIVTLMYVLMFIGDIRKRLRRRRDIKHISKWCPYCLSTKTYYNVEHDNFYCEHCKKRMGQIYYNAHIDHSHEFPQKTALEEA